MTMTQKILAKAAGKQNVIAGELIEANLSLLLANDITGPVSIKEFEKIGKVKVFDNTKIALVPDHFTPNKDIKSAENSKALREFSVAQSLTNYFEIGQMGIEHCLLPEKGLVAPGDVIIGADSHTCTYGAVGAFSTGVGSTDLAVGMATGKAWFKVPSALKFELVNKPAKWISGKDIILHIIGLIGVDGALYKSMEFTGDGLKYLTMDDRFTITNMAIEAGAKNGIIEVDDICINYLKTVTDKPYTIFKADEDAIYDECYKIDLSNLKPVVAFPHLPENTHNLIDKFDIALDQVVIGSCTNGRLDDLRIAAEILKNKTVAKNLRCIVVPGTQKIYLDALKQGYIEIFITAGAIVSTPTCGPCLGGHMGVLAKGEKAISTTNRNFVGRMGDPTSEIYLASPAVAAASAITGVITHPDYV